jgi:hypothetical protein
MANKHRGEISIKLDKIRKLKYTTNSLAELEDQLGYSLGRLDEHEIGFKTLIKMTWAGLIHEDPDLTLKEIGDLMDYSDVNTIAEKIREALDLSMGMDKDTNKDNEKKI